MSALRNRSIRTAQTPVSQRLRHDCTISRRQIGAYLVRHESIRSLGIKSGKPIAVKAKTLSTSPDSQNENRREPRDPDWKSI